MREIDILYAIVVAMGVGLLFLDYAVIRMCKSIRSNTDVTNKLILAYNEVTKSVDSLRKVDSLIVDTIAKSVDASVITNKAFDSLTSDYMRISADLTKMTDLLEETTNKMLDSERERSRLAFGIANLPGKEEIDILRDWISHFDFNMLTCDDVNCLNILSETCDSIVTAVDILEGRICLKEVVQNE